MRVLFSLALVLLGVAGAPAKPSVVQRPIPFSAARRSETAAYALRHYGLNTWRLRATA